MRSSALLFCLAALPAAASAAQLTFSPAVPLAGEPFVATFVDRQPHCFDQSGSLQFLGAVAGGELTLELFPPGCPIPSDFKFDYAAAALVPGLPAGSYTVKVRPFFGRADVYTQPLTIRAAPDCTASDTALCLAGRFAVTAQWTVAGTTRPAWVVPGDGLGYTAHGRLWFSSPDNPELMVKVLDACAVNGRRWVFVSPGTNLGFRITVVDAVTRQEVVFTNPAGQFPRLLADTGSFPC
jgi:hypothetical protein